MKTLDRFDRNLIGWSCAFALLGCGEGLPTSSSPLARVGQQQLTSEYVSVRLPDGLNPEDSSVLAERIIDQWIREQVLVLQAERSLDPAELQFEDEIRAYRNALLMHAFKERFVNERLNQMVSEEEALNFYEENRQSFRLTDYAIRVLFINAPLGADVSPIQQAFAEIDSTGMLDIERWCVENAAEYALDGSSWWTLSDFTKEVPMNFYRTASQLANRKLISFEANERQYLVRFLEHALKDDTAPFTAVKEEATEMILHQRKRALLLNLEEQLVVKAWSEGLVERYNKESEGD